MCSGPRAFVILVIVSAWIVGCAVPVAAQSTTEAVPGSIPAIQWRDSTTSGPAPELARFNELLADLAERLRPGLVHVRVRHAVSTKADGSDEPSEPRRATGSGFIVDDRGVIVTNAHVVEGAETIQVRLADGRRFPGKVVGRDNRVDLALLTISGATGLTALPIADSNRLRVGEFVMALGHPFGLEHSVSFGIVSRKGAPLTVAAPGFDFIQTDAAINPGNSGGPLVNMAGQVVGVNSMAARNGSIGFAIPANLVKLLVPQLASKGKVEWGWLGVSIAEIGEDDLEKLGLKEPRGVLIRSVMSGEPADKGGIKPNDILLAAGGTRLDTPRDLQRVVSSSPVGSRLKIILMREGREQEIEVTVGLYKERAERQPEKEPEK
jgi:serine protease Do